MIRRGVDCYLLVFMLLAQCVHGQTLDELIAAGELEARAVVETEVPLFQKAPIVISVDVGTPHRFSKGIHVRDFAVPGALVRPVSKFPMNETRRRGGDSWDFQILRFQIYSERVGMLGGPVLTTSISVETGTGALVEGTLELSVADFKVEVPPGVEGLDIWVAATALEVEESWEGALDSYRVGDAVTRIRRFTIKGAPAMAIPESPSIEFDGLHLYSAPALVDDKAVGGSLQGGREERVVFTFKAGGSYTIPGSSLSWFNLETQTVEQVEFASRTFEVQGGGGPRVNWGAWPTGVLGRLFPWLCVLLAGVLSYGAVQWFRRTAGYQSLYGQLRAWRDLRQAKAAFMKAAAQQDSRRCLALLYQRMAVHADWQLREVCADDPQLSAVSAALMAHAYGEGQAPEAKELQLLWKVCSKRERRLRDTGVLRLNPKSTN